MKNIIITLICLLLVSCGHKEYKPEVDNKDEVNVDTLTIEKMVSHSVKKWEAIPDKPLSLKDSCINIIDRGTNAISASILGDISIDSANKYSNPIMARYQILWRNLPSKERYEVQKYREDKLNELVDLKLSRNN